MSREIISSNLTRLMKDTPSLNSQPKLQAKSGVAQATIGRILRQEVSASVDTLEDIARAFGKDDITCLVSKNGALNDSAPNSSAEFFEAFGSYLESLPIKELIKVAGRIEAVVDKSLAMAEEENNKE